MYKYSWAFRSDSAMISFPTIAIIRSPSCCGKETEVAPNKRRSRRGDFRIPKDIFLSIGIKGNNKGDLLPCYNQFNHNPAPEVSFNP